jgi:molecular chaperone DnaK (HSP70)
MKTTSRHIFGIDLGTSSCSIAYATADPRHKESQTVGVQTVEIPVDAEHAGLFTRRIPSIVSAPPESARGGALFGGLFAAPHRKKKGATLMRRGRDFFSSAKSDLGTLKVYTRSRVPGCRTPAEVTTVILDRLRGIAHERNASLDLRKAPVVITVPATSSALARTETLDAAGRAGFDRASVRLLDEPVAALLDLLNGPEATEVLDAQPRNLLVFDYGAGTCDVALLRARFDPATATGLHVENLAISSYHRLGGDDVDAAIMDQVVWPQLCTAAEREALGMPRRREVEDTLTGSVARALKEQMCRDVERRVRESSWAEVEAKPVRALVPVEHVFDVPELGRPTPRRFEMDSRQFTAVMAPFLSRPTEADEPRRSILFPVYETLARAGLRADALDGVVLHGGSSQNPFVRRLMDSTFGHDDLFQRTKVVMTPDALVSVARGAAVACYWREERGVEFVRPNMPEVFGVLLRDERRVPLIAAGTPLPYPDADGVEDVTDDGAPFSVPTDDAPALLVPFYTGTDAQHRLAGTIKVPLPAGMAAGTPVRIAARVEPDKTVKWWFRVGEGETRPAPAVDDPWTARALTGEERKLMEVRRSLRDALAEGRPVTQAMLVAEANALRRAGRSDEGLLAIEDCLAENGGDGHAHNVRALLLADLDREDDALDAHRRAMECLPDVAVYVANYGIALQARAGEADASIATLRLALEKDPSLGYAYAGLGSAYRMKGDEARAQVEYRRALEVFRKDVERAPFSRDSWSRLCVVHQALGDYRRAEEARVVLRRIDRDVLYDGDSAQVIAGPARPSLAPSAS